MIETIKKCALEFLKTTENDSEVDIPVFTNRLQATIIVSIGVGREKADLMLDFEFEDGHTEKRNFCEIL